MVRVEFLGPMSHIPPRELDVSDLGALKAALAGDKELERWLPLSAVAVNDVLVDSLSHPLQSGDNVLLLPPVCGG